MINVFAINLYSRADEGLLAYLFIFRNVAKLYNCTYKNVKCPNGQCIPMDKLCDGVIDCDDQFDER